MNDKTKVYDNCGLCDSLISDLNSLPKLLMNGQHIQFCAVVTGMAQKLLNLKKGIKSDLDSMKEKVEELKCMNDDLVKQTTGLPVKKDGANNGSK